MSGKKVDFGALFAGLEQDLTYQRELATLAFTEEVSRIMAEEDVSRAELARRLGTSQAYVTKLLRGNGNFTLETMVKIAGALDATLQTRLQRHGILMAWFTMDVQGDADTASAGMEIRIGSYKESWLDRAAVIGENADAALAITA